MRVGRVRHAPLRFPPRHLSTWRSASHTTPQVRIQGFSYVADNVMGKRPGPEGEGDVNTRIANQSEHKQALLIVDDEPASMRALCDTLEYEGYQTYGFTSP